MHKMQKLASVSLLLSLLFTTANPAWAGKSNITGPKLLRILIGKHVPMRQAEWALLKRYLNSPMLQKQLQGAGTTHSALRQLQQLDPRISFSSVTAEQPRVKAVLSMIDIQQFVAQHDNQFPTPQDTEAFKQVLEILVFAQTKQIDGSVKDMLADLYVGPESPVTPAALPKRVEDIDGWMKNTPPEVQLAAVHAGLSKTKKPAPGKQPTTQPAVAANPHEKTEPLAQTYYSAQEALDRLYNLVSKTYTRRPQRSKTKALPTPFGSINDFWAVLSFIHADRTGQLSASQKDDLLNWVYVELEEEVKQPDLVRQEVHAWQGNTSLQPALPDPKRYPSAFNIFKAPPAKKMEWKLAVDMWYLKQLIPVEDQPQWLQNWDPYAKQPGGPKLATGHTDLSAPRPAVTNTSRRNPPTTPQAQGTRMLFRDANDALDSLSRIPYPHIFPHAQDNPKNFLAVIYLLEKVQANELSAEQQERFINLTRHTSLEATKWTKELVEQSIDLICSRYNIEKTLSLPSVKDYPTVQDIQKVDKGLKNLWSVLVALRTAQLALPEILDDELKALELPFGKEPVAPTATHTTFKGLSLSELYDYSPKNSNLVDLAREPLIIKQWPLYVEDMSTLFNFNLAQLQVIKDASAGKLSQPDLICLYSLFKISENTSVQTIEQKLKEWQQKENTTRLPQFSYNYLKARSLEDGMFTDDCDKVAYLKYIRENGLAATIYLLQQTTPADELPEILRQNVMK